MSNALKRQISRSFADLEKEQKRYTFTTFKFFTKDSPLIDSGLLGPVNLEVTEQKLLK